MELNLKKWEAYMQQDPAFRTGCKRLNPEGLSSHQKGDLLCLEHGKRPMVVSWDGKQLLVERANAEKAFSDLESSAREKYAELFLPAKPPGPCRNEQ